LRKEGGALIALEGIDGAGKSTQINRLSRWLREHNVNVYVTSEPTNRKWGAVIRNFSRSGRRIHAV